MDEFFKRTFFNVRRSTEKNNDCFTEEGIRELKNHEGENVFFDNMLDYNQKTFEPFCARGHQRFGCFIFVQIQFCFTRKNITP